MSYRKILPVVLLFMFAAALSAFAQRDTVSLNTIIHKSVKYTNDYPVEKVYVHFDKPYYAAGDTIWLKTYVTVDQHVPSTMSRIVYVDLYNSQDSLMRSLKLLLSNGMAAGNIALPPDAYKQGNYRLRAYTDWMLNFDPAYLFTKIIPIGNPVGRQVFTHVSYSGGTAQSPIKVRIQYNDDKGRPYAGKKIGWRVEASHEETSKGKESTDANGYITITLPPTSSLALGASTLFTEIDMDDHKTVTSSFSLKPAAPGKDVQFFPEGGDLIAGVPMRIAVKAIKADGLGIAVKGTITDNDGKVAASFSSQHLGMGMFSLLPESGKTYKANVTFADGAQGNYNLPRVQNSGITLTVNNTDANSLGLRITANDAYFQANQNKSFYIVAQTGGFIKYAAQTTLQKQVYSAAIPKDKFSTGILQITLFAGNGNPVSERLVFIRRNDLLKLDVSTDKPLYNRRQPVKLKIATKNGAAPVMAGLSVAVIDEQKVPVDEDAETTILTSLLLTSDLRGYVEKPNYYFKNEGDKTLEDLDILMMTQGYRRFSYRDIISGRMPKIAVMPEQGIEISGILRDRTGLPIFKGNVSLQIPDRNFTANTITNADGVFKFQNVMINDSMQVVLSARNNVNANNLMLMVDGQRYPGVTRMVNLPDERQNIDSAMAPYLENSKKQYESTHLLKEVVIKSTSTVKRPSHLDQPALMGLNPEPDHLIDGSRFKGCTFFVSCLQSMALGVTYVDENFYVTRSYNAGDRSPMSVYVDGMPVDQNFLASINAAEVESVEIFMNDGLSGINRRDGTNGVLVINKKKAPKGTKVSLDQLRELIPPPYIAKIMPRGYSMVKQFYSPKYEAGKPSNIGIDLRSTIYWNPNVITDKTTGSATLQYFNADGTGTYRAVVEGIDQNGDIGRAVIKYKVQ